MTKLILGFFLEYIKSNLVIFQDLRTTAFLLHMEKLENTQLHLFNAYLSTFFVPVVQLSHRVYICIGSSQLPVSSDSNSDRTLGCD